MKESAMVYATTITCPSGHTYDMEIIDPRISPAGEVTGYLGSDADLCRVCGSSIEEEEPAVDDLPEPGRVPIWLSAEELGLLRAGLAAHSIALDALRHTDTPLSPDDRRAIYKQKDQARELSIRLGDAQNRIE